MNERIFKNWKTTVFGILLLAVCFVLVWFEKATLSEVGGFVPVGFGFFFLKDGSIKKIK